MKKVLLFSFLISIFIFTANVNAKEEQLPDPLYLNSPVLDMDKMEPVEKKKEDPRTFEEKFRAKFHLKPTKKHYYHNIDKSMQPVTMDDYLVMAKDKKRSEFEIPEPVFNAGVEDYIMPDPHFRVIRYNTPPGQRNIDLSQLVATRTASSAGILSPDKTKMVYTKSSFYPRYSTTTSSAYYIPVKNTNDAYEALYMTNVIQQQMTPIVNVGMDELIKYQFRTLFPIDFSKDSMKIAFKEKVGSNSSETWQTNIIIYDFKEKDWKRLTAVREAIVYWWRQNKQIELKDYMWDIFPVGWHKQNPDRLVVYAYAFTGQKPFFLGTWSIDSNEEKSELISIDSTQVEIDLNGFGLKEVKLEH